MEAWQDAIRSRCDLANPAASEGKDDIFLPYVEMLTFTPEDLEIWALTTAYLVEVVFETE